jgi:OOP family OmpA-OmpF porin
MGTLMDALPAAAKAASAAPLPAASGVTAAPADMARDSGSKPAGPVGPGSETALVAIPAVADAAASGKAAAPAAGGDGDGDGVPNDVDLCPEKRGTDGSLGCPAEDGIALGGIVFRYDSDELTEDSKAILDRLARKLVRIKEARLEVAGHTDARGDALYNLDLSERRARAVRDYLVERGVNPSRLTAKGYGQTKPLADNESSAGRAVNRRVELRPV